MPMTDCHGAAAARGAGLERRPEEASGPLVRAVGSARFRSGVQGAQRVPAGAALLGVGPATACAADGRPCAHLITPTGPPPGDAPLTRHTPRLAALPLLLAVAACPAQNDNEDDKRGPGAVGAPCAPNTVLAFLS